mgnify:CR=1 FL=1
MHSQIIMFYLTFCLHGAWSLLHEWLTLKLHIGGGLLEYILEVKPSLLSCSISRHAMLC